MSASSSTRVVTALAVLVAAAVLVPLAVIVPTALSEGPGRALELLVRPRVALLLGNTGLLIATTVPATLVLGTGAAWLVERTDLPWPGMWRTLMIAPLAVPSFVSAYAWTTVAPALDGLAGAALVTTLAYLPFVFLPVAAVLRRLDPGDEEVARSLGLSPVAALARTVLPRLRPALSGGALLVTLHLLAEYGVLELMRFQTFTTAIMQQYGVGFSDAAGSVLATVLLALCLLALGLEVVARGNRRVSRLGPGAQRAATRARLGRWRLPALAALAVTGALAVLVPVATVVGWFAIGQALTGVDAKLLGLVGTTMGLAAVAAAVTTAAALPGAWLLERTRSRLAHGLERATYVASALPGVVIGLALVALAVRWARPLYQTTVLLVVAYALLFLPRAMVSLRSGFAASSPELSEAARSLGAGGAATFTRVVLPLMSPSVLAGIVLVALAVSTELTATLLLAPTGVETLAIAFWREASVLDYAGAAPYAGAMIALSVPLTLLMRGRILEAR